MRKLKCRTTFFEEVNYISFSLLLFSCVLRDNEKLLFVACCPVKCKNI